ncbi:MAG: hypothetical protein GY835_18045 [bacterium]|nr:hypothetical protein [bacterium]
MAITVGDFPEVLKSSQSLKIILKKFLMMSIKGAQVFRENAFANGRPGISILGIS